MKILMCDSAEALNRDLEIEKKFLRNVLGDDTRIEVYAYENDNHKLIDKLQGVDGILTSYLTLDREILESTDQLKAISIEATGYNFVDADAAKENQISVSVIGEYCTQEVADHTMALLLALARKLKHYRNQIEIKQKYDYNSTSGMFRLEGATLGIMGLGKIGKAVAKRAKGFGLRVIAYHPTMDPVKAKELDVELVSFGQLLEESNIISLHMRQTDENVGIIDKEAFCKMKKKPILLNVSRGAMIVEEDLLEALDKELIYGAGLDVLEDETKEGIQKNPLVGRENVILTPHSAFYSDTSLFECQRIGAENLAYQLKEQYEKVFRIVTK